MLAAREPVTTIDATFRRWASQGFVWLPEHGMGFWPVREDDEPYRNGGAQAYWDKYVEYSRTPLGEALTAARVELVRGWTNGPVLDIGIGAGSFVEALYTVGGTAYGFDVNPIAVSWLQARGLWRDPWEPGVDLHAVSLWDVLEHLPDPGALLERVSGYVFTSLPIFESGEQVLCSKHFRPDEHRWYWTRQGLVHWMARLGFECVEQDERESLLGREAIGTFAFRRVG